jgi:hypothetical protein
MKEVTAMFNKSLMMILAMALVCAGLCSTALAQTNVITYQGRLTEGGSPADGLFDIQFKLFDTQAVGTGAQQGVTVTHSSVQVTNGTFTVQLDFFLPVFDGSARYLEVSIRPTGSSGAYSVMGPRQAITSTPYAVRSQSAAFADTAVNAIQLGGQLASGFIQNSTAPQAGTNFNISGSGTVAGTLTAGTVTGGVVNAATQYNLGGLRMLAANGPFTDILGNSLAVSNSFLGEDAGVNTMPAASTLDSLGKMNSYFGAKAGASNTTGSENSFFGTFAGFNNTTGAANSFVGKNAGGSNTSGTANSFVGVTAGGLNTTGSNNTFLGTFAGFNNTTGSNNTIIGMNATVVGGDLTFATALGAGSSVSTSNTIALGRSNGSDKVKIFGLGIAGIDHLCRNFNNEVSSCSSSLRYKTNIAPFNSGFSLINQLRPISFDWKTGGMHDIGFGAEDVERINPLFVSYNSKGEVEGVKYDRLSVLFVNAFREQQAQIETQRSRIEQQQRQLDAQQRQIEGLRRLVCAQNPAAEVCKEGK